MSPKNTQVSKIKQKQNKKQKQTKKKCAYAQ